MVALILSLLFIIGMIAQFYLKFAPLKSFLCLFGAIFSFVLALTFYESIAGIMISKGFMVQWAQTLSFTVLALLGPLALIGISDFIIGSNVDFGPVAKYASAIILGGLTGIIASGMFNIGAALTPGKKVIPYARFGDRISVNNPSKPAIPSDDLIVGLYSLISGGSMSASNPFGIVHADYLNRLHINRFACKEGVATVAGKNAVKVGKYDLVKKELSEGDTRTIVTLNISKSEIEKGGAMDSNKNISFIPGQVAMACSKKSGNQITAKDVKIFYPESYQIPGEPAKEDISLSEIINLDRKKSTSKSTLQVNMIYSIPENSKPLYIAFKNNTIVKLPKVMTPEQIEQAKQEDAKNAAENTQE